MTVLAKEVDAFILLSQVDQPDTGVLTKQVLKSVAGIAQTNPKQVMVADSRHSLKGFPSVVFKMNAAELRALTGMSDASAITDIRAAAA
ncbi:MAG: carbohydrate kinase, partial [Verrucomicrobia bacterium]|nr:carbohydrate kinase [Verrucomicrobiota bacterium]